MEKKSRLGRGLEALIGDENTPTATAEVPVDSIENNPYQPRKTFDDARLADVLDSIGRRYLDIAPLLRRATRDAFAP